MRSKLWRSSLFGLGMFVAGAAFATAAAPMWRVGLTAVYQDDYASLSYRCDYAMRDHLIAKQRLDQDPSKANVDGLRAMEIGLIACQDYDLLRKHLIRWGLSENDLSEMALVAIEDRAQNLADVVRIHEIRY
ncbi:TIGR03982 family His-Xaa-Ser system protein [Devosia sp. Leaf64]|uniref:TIGR03982 family His-Xaa-Ser system protein n=1 Tax=Devosia sp. Leaf64 TaxID=1736229 RepID=UPI001FCD5C70|nr:TIGR03982 family His-Xaa-Ser system protein [Devosia sp. Leaf64]